MEASAITTLLQNRVTWSQQLKDTLAIQDEVADQNDPKLWHMFNDGSVEVEVAEFLFGLVRMLKPQLILETGTHRGISSAFMAEGCRVNGRGHVVTLEWDEYYWRAAEKLFKALSLWDCEPAKDYVTCIHADTTQWMIDMLDPITGGKHPSIDILFLDSEPDLRYREFERYYDYVKPGGLIFIHDLHPNMSYSKGIINPDHPSLGSFWPFGSFVGSIGVKELDREIQAVHFHGLPRGFSMFYKVDLDTRQDVDINWAAGRLELVD